MKKTKQIYDKKHNLHKLEKKIKKIANVGMTAYPLISQTCTRNRSVVRVFQRFGFMVYNTTFNNITVISWWAVLLVEELGENHGNHGKPVTSH